jgi:hypothetical protein
MAVADNLDEHFRCMSDAKLRITLYFFGMNAVFFEVSKEPETHILPKLYISKIIKPKEVYALSSQLRITIVLTFCMEGPSSCVVMSYTVCKAAWKM